MSTRYHVMIPPEAMWAFPRETRNTLMADGCHLGTIRLASAPVVGDMIKFFLATRNQEDEFKSYTSWRVLMVAESDIAEMGIPAMVIVEPYEGLWTVAGPEYVKEWVPC